MSEKDFYEKIDKNFAKLVQLYKSLIPKHGSKVIDTGLFKKLLDKDFDINYKIPDSYNVFENDWVSGCTILQLVGSIPDVYQVLIDHGADYTVKDKDGSTALLRDTTSYGCSYSKGTTEVYDSTIRTGYGHYLQSLTHISRHDADDKESCANIILSAHINSENHTNPKDKNGLSHFHVACMYNRRDVATFFLDNGVPINETVNQDSKFYPGFSALHFAVLSGAVETVELLLTRGANIYAKDSKGMNPLHTLMVERKKILINVKRNFKTTSSDEPKFKPMKSFAAAHASMFGKSTHSNLYDHHLNNQKIISLFLERMIELGHHFNSDTELTYFHMLCFTGKTLIMKKHLDNNIQSLSHTISIDSTIWRGYTPLHCAANFSLENVEFLLEKGADLGVKDAKGVTPFELCMKEFSIADVHRIISLQPDYFNITFSNSKTKLGDFIHAMQDSTTFENFLKDNIIDPNMFIPFDSPVCAGYTPLHLTVICAEQPMNWSSKNYDTAIDCMFDMFNLRQYFLRIESCLKNNSSSHTSQDARGSTPLHWAFRLQQGQAVRMLLKVHETNSNCIDEHGLSHLHIACAAGNETVVQKLLAGGANLNVAVTSSYTWLEKDKVGIMLVKFRCDKYFINKGSTTLHFAVKWPKIVEILIQHGADVLAQDVDGLNPLERVFGIPIFQDSGYLEPTRLRSFGENEEKVIKLLLRKIGERLADTKPRQMLYCYSLMRGELFFEILSLADESVMKILKSVGITPLHVACFTQDLSQVEKLAGKIDVNARVSMESPLWPGCTPLHLFSKSKTVFEPWEVMSAIATKLLERGADVGAVNVEGETPIHGIFPFDWTYLDEMLEHLQDFGVNPTSKKGFSHLHIASACGAVSIVQQLLENGAAVDQPTDYFIKDYGGLTPLHFAALHGQKDVVKVLLKHGANVNRRDASGENSLHAACKGIRRSCLELLQSLIGAGADVHVANMYGETPFEVLIKSTDTVEKEVELFLEHDCRINTYDSVSGGGFLAIALNKHELPIFELLTKAFDVKIIDSNGRNAIHNTVAFKLPDKDYSEDEYDEGYDLEEAIDDKYTSSDNYIRAIALLIEFGMNIDQQDYEGFTPLHVAVRMKNVTGIIGLLENGADINVTDVHGNTYILKLDNRYYSRLDSRIMEIISIHIHKLNLAKIGISMANKQIQSKILVNEGINVNELADEYIDEIEKMRKEKITSTSIVFHKFLSDTGVVSTFPHMQLCDRIAIEAFFTNEIEKLRKKFPHFAGILLLQYRKALARGDLIDPAAISLDILVGFDMPLICSDIILKFLSNDELNNLISSVAAE